MAELRSTPPVPGYGITGVRDDDDAWATCDSCHGNLLGAAVGSCPNVGAHALLQEPTHAHGGEKPSASGPGAVDSRPREGDWLCTFTGKRFWPCDPRPEEICIEDIAHALAIENRFGGHLPQPYSVAQHSALASWIAESHLGGSIEDQKWALLHDATEAYLKDIPRPLKRALGDTYKRLERRMASTIAERFGLAGEMPALVKKADEICLTLERRDLFSQSHHQFWTLGGPEKDIPKMEIFFIDWRDAKAAFLRRFRILFPGEVAGG